MGSNSKQNQLPLEAAKADDAYLSALLLCFSRVFPAVLNAAVDLNLFEIIAKAQNSSLSASEIASQLPNQHPELANRLERMLPVLASYSLLTCTICTNGDGNRERVYALSPMGEYFACDKDGGSLGPLSTLFHQGFHDVWYDVKDAIINPDNKNHFRKVNGLPCYQYMEKDKELNHIFNKAMAQSGPLEIKRILKLYKGFEGVSILVDVGGGVGQALKQIISGYPSIKGINFDLPQVIQDAPPHPGIEHVGGNMFESVPKGDSILLKLVLHNWSDVECVKILRNCHKALPKHGKDRGELKVVNHFRTISESKIQHAEVMALVEASGLSTLSKCTLKMADKGLLSVLAERWHRETSSFHMPISGALWTQPGLDREGCCMLLVELLGVTPSQAYLAMQETRGLHAHFSTLRDVYSSRIAEEAWEAAARAYLLHLVGCTIFAGKSATYVDIVFLDLFRDLGTCSRYTWGVAALTFMYDQLGAACVAGTKQIAGYLTLM